MSRPSKPEASPQADAAARRAAAVSEVVAALVKLDAADREPVLVAVRAIISMAPPQAAALGMDPGQVLGGMLSR